MTAEKDSEEFTQCRDNPPESSPFGVSNASESPPRTSDKEHFAGRSMSTTTVAWAGTVAVATRTRSMLQKCMPSRNSNPRMRRLRSQLQAIYWKYLYLFVSKARNEILITITRPKCAKPDTRMEGPGTVDGNQSFKMQMTASFFNQIFLEKRMKIPILLFG